MKKTIIFFAVALSLFTPVFAAESKNSTKSDSKTTETTTSENETEEEAEWQKKSKEALDKTGKFFKQIGSEIKEIAEDTYTNATEIRCLGTWVYKSDHYTTTIIFEQNGICEIQKKSGLETEYWKGTFTVTIHSISFTIHEFGKKGQYKKYPQSFNDQKWYLSYYTTDNADEIKIVSDNIPTDADGTDFSKGVIFKKK